MKKIGFIGLGIMGKPMAENLINAGVELLVNDLNEDAVSELEKLGATSSSVKEIGKQCDIIFTMLPNGEIVNDILSEVLNHVEPETIFCDMSSITPIEAENNHENCKRSNCEYVDAPVSGGEPGAIDGSLAFMVGGSEQVFEALKDYFDIMGSSAILVGETGSGSVTKLANQIIVNNNIAVVSEALVFAKKAGADPNKVYEAIRGGLAGSSVLDAKAPKIINRDFTPGGKISINHKDIKNVVNAAHEMDVPVPYTAQLFEILQSLKVDNQLDKDHSAIVHHFEKLADAVVDPN
ncbi:2-hydroxy-3-oxopropionate reductase [Tetragenococcus halophilus subsp. flandriensis]|uniref:NAD(P)-binding domain-containing protein n=1 Tax=Tetragenococcus halophilus TaxID=51669 RepID=UPI0023E9FFF2|nr:NAD(P)-binding domain-containing protein [Tetragenococcus halophilus]GMA08776.1 2-hydroxy-3-oxopropionate reductase [Tetragenococcus halophilus subsp. flandriensis]